MCFKIDYIPVFVNSLQAEISFFTEKLGFEILGDGVYYNTKKCKLLKPAGGSPVIGIVESNQAQRQTKASVLLNTTDCLEDYHLLKAAGVSFISEPHYSKTGLAAEFADLSGNSYLLFEPRNYED